ncbi:MAG: CPBP family intramembrane glutamic endopeptidase [Limisphaerales bacterium]
MNAEPPPVLAGFEPSPPPVARHRSIAMLAILLAVPLFLGSWGSDRSGGGDGGPVPAALPGSIGGLLWICGLNLAIFLVVGAGIVALGRPSRRELFAAAPFNGKTWALGFLYSILLRLGVGVVLAVSLALWTGLMPRSGPVEEVVESIRPRIETMINPVVLRDPVYLLLVTTLVSFVVAGLREELWRAAVFAAFRRCWPRWMSRRIGRVGIVLLTALSFGLGHLPQGWGGVALTGVLGVGLGWVLLAHRSLWVAVVAHGFFDATSLLLLRLLDTADGLERFLGKPPVP